MGKLIFVLAFASAVVTVYVEHRATPAENRFMGLSRPGFLLLVLSVAVLVAGLMYDTADSQEKSERHGAVISGQAGIAASIAELAESLQDQQEAQEAEIARLRVEGISDDQRSALDQHRVALQRARESLRSLSARDVSEGHYEAGKVPASGYAVFSHDAWELRPYPGFTAVLISGSRSRWRFEPLRWPDGTPVFDAACNLVVEQGRDGSTTVLPEGEGCAIVVSELLTGSTYETRAYARTLD